MVSERSWETGDQRTNYFQGTDGLEQNRHRLGKERHFEMGKVRLFGGGAGVNYRHDDDCSITLS